MKVKKKGGKVFPPPPPPSSSSVNGKRAGEGNVLSVLNLLPVAILALISILCFEDREVIAYMITRSINAANPSPSILPKKPKKKSNRNNRISKNNPSVDGVAASGGFQGHKPPVFYCDCFDCYINYWYRWNSSPNRELIHEAIDAFDEHLSSDEKSRKIPKSCKRRDRGKRRNGEKPLISPVNKTDKPPSSSPMENVLYPITSSKTPVTGSAMSVRSLWSTYKGFARKVLLLPVLLGLLNSHLWSLWNPNA